MLYEAANGIYEGSDVDIFFPRFVFFNVCMFVHMYSCCTREPTAFMRAVLLKVFY